MLSAFLMPFFPKPAHQITRISSKPFTIEEEIRLMQKATKLMPDFKLQRIFPLLLKPRIKKEDELPYYLSLGGEEKLYDCPIDKGTLPSILATTSLIEKLISSMLDAIVLDVDSNEKKIKNFINQNPLAVKVIDRNNSLPIENIPLFSKFNNKIDSCVTNTSGECDFFIDQEHLSKDPTQYLYIGVDKSKLYNTELDYSDFKSKINITLEPINIALDIKEYNFNSSVSQSYIEPVIKEFFLKESNVIFTKDILESDLIINIETETRSNSNKANEYGLFKAFCDSSIDVKFPDNDESILKLKVTSQAVDFQSLEQAGYKSLEKNSQIIFNETLVDLVSILTQN
mgnify:CR=1 FL=1